MSRGFVFIANQLPRTQLYDEHVNIGLGVLIKTLISSVSGDVNLFHQLMVAK